MNLKKSYLALVITFAIALGGCNSKNAVTNSASSAKPDSAGHAHGVQPCGCCAAKLQSPIKIDRNTAVPAPKLQVSFHGELTQMVLKNDGHAFKTMPANPTMNNNYVFFNKQQYFFKEFHFHHPSEHWINGMRAPMEMHIVYENKQTGTNVVAGLLIDTNGRPNTSLNGFFNQFPTPGVIQGRINLSDVIQFNANDVYYTYVGSLTTGAYTEGVA